MKPTRLAIIVATILMVVVACGGGNNMEPTTSLADAQATAQKAVKDAAAAVFPPGFTLQDQGPQPLNCTDSAGKADGRVLVGVSFWVDGPDRAQNNSYFDALKNWWSTHGWSLVKDKRPGDMFINASHDDYLMSLESTTDGRLTIGASTPCVWRYGTPPPSK